MLPIRPCDIPENALLEKYNSNKSYDERAGYTDCYSVTLDGLVRQEDYIYAFYTSAIFKIERLLLKYLFRKPSTDEQARQLANGNAEIFSAWLVESRSDNQLLMCDFQNRTRSWLMVLPVEGEIDSKTLLLFGSAVVPVKNPKTGKKGMGVAFNLLLGFHKLYSRILLYSAIFRLKKIHRIERV